MEFNERLQELRKNKGLTQEELAEALYVSRTAISKWESGRGYPSLDSLKEISAFFEISIDELLSGEKILSIAEDENKSNIRRICNYLMGAADIFACTLIFLPLFPNPIDGYIYSVNLLSYTYTTKFNLTLYWILFVLLIVCGIVRIVTINSSNGKMTRAVTLVSVLLSILTVLFLAMTREAYAVALVFLLLIFKGFLIYKSILNKK